MRRVVETGEPTVVEWGGEPVVVVMSLDEYERYSVTEASRAFRCTPPWARVHVFPTLAGA